MLLSGNVNFNNINLYRGNFYKFSYTNLNSNMEDPLVLNPLIVFSAIDRNRRIHGLNIRILRNPYIFLEDYRKFYIKNDILNPMYTPEHKYAFSFNILKALFKRNPDIENAWRIYNPIYIKHMNLINNGDIESELDTLNKVRLSNMGVK